MWLGRREIGKTGIIIANTGSPAAPTSAAVADYLRRFLSDPRICPINPHLWRFVLERFIIPKRAPASADKYKAVWTDVGSPLEATMVSFSKKLRASLTEDEAAFVGCAMSYSLPSMEDALTQCRILECDEAVVVPLYPQSAFSTTGVVKDKVSEALRRLGWAPRVRIVESYGDDPGYIDAIAASVARSGFDQGNGDKLLFAFHSIPMADIRAGDTYGDQTQRTAREVALALGLGPASWAVGYQCRFDKSRAWLGPSTTQALDDLADAGRLFVIAPNFAIDCLETLYDIDIVLRRRYEDVGGRFHYVPCLNDSGDQLELLKELINC